VNGLLYNYGSPKIQITDNLLSFFATKVQRLQLAQIYFAYLVYHSVLVSQPAGWQVRGKLVFNFKRTIVFFKIKKAGNSGLKITGFWNLIF